MTYVIPDPLPWTALAGPLTAAEDALARLDERLGSSPIREGWVNRTHFMEACASLWLQGERVHPEDLVLHDAEMERTGEGGFDDDAFTAELAAIDALLERSTRVLAGAVPPARRTRSRSFTTLTGTKRTASRSGDAGSRTPGRCRPSSRPR